MGLFAVVPLALALGAGAYFIPCRLNTCAGHALSGGGARFETTLRPGAEVIWIPAGLNDVSGRPLTISDIDVDTASGFGRSADIRKVELVPKSFGSGLFGTYPPLDETAEDPCAAQSLRRPDGLTISPRDHPALAVWLQVLDQPLPQDVTSEFKIQGVRYTYEQSGKTYEAYDPLKLTVTVDPMAEQRPLTLAESSCENVIQLPR
jgi:hypothetical protein